MASAANVFRKATIELLTAQLVTLEKTVGLILKCYRDYESPTKPSKTQAEVAAATKTRQPIVSSLENGQTIPDDALLASIMTEIGLAPHTAAPQALFRVLQLIRDEKTNLAKLKKHFP